MAKRKAKVVEFETKVLHKEKVYLRVADVSKALGYKSGKLFTESNADIVVAIKGCGKLVLEEDYNLLLQANEEALDKQEHIEVTKVQTLRSEIKSSMSMYGFKMIFGREYHKAMAQANNCTVEEFIANIEIPKDKQSCVDKLSNIREINKSYTDDIAYLNREDIINLDKLRSCGLDMQYMTSIDTDGKMKLNSYIVGDGVFMQFNQYSYYQWDNIYINENGETVVPYFDYDSDDGIEEQITLSNIEVDRDFRNYTAMENIIWCVENLEVIEGHDYEYATLEYSSQTIEFEITNNLICKIINPNSTKTEYVNGIVNFTERAVVTTGADKIKFIDVEYADQKAIGA